jgi:hypothetical protein
MKTEALKRCNTDLLDLRPILGQLVLVRHIEDLKIIHTLKIRYTTTGE